MSETKLLPCPFCGGEAYQHGGGGHHCVRCSKCGITNESLKIGEHYYTAYFSSDEAATAWNTRAQPANEPLTLDELRKMDGEPVWAEYRAPVKVGEPWGVKRKWMLVGDECIYNQKSYISFEHIGIDAMAYRRKPEKE